MFKRNFFFFFDLKAKRYKLFFFYLEKSGKKCKVLNFTKKKNYLLDYFFFFATANLNITPQR